MEKRIGRGGGAGARAIRAFVYSVFRPQREELMAELAKGELAPQSDADRFFVEFKRTAIDAFYASALIQREHLGYRAIQR